MKTVTGLFDDYSDASAAVSALEARGVPSSDISIVSNNADERHNRESNAAEGAGAGAGIGAAVGGAAGGLIGALTDSGVPEDHAHVYAEGVRRGGTLVTAKVDDSLYSEAEAILRNSNLVDPDQRRAAYAEGGWTRFDDTLDPYGPAEIEQERLRYRR